MQAQRESPLQSVSVGGESCTFELGAQQKMAHTLDNLNVEHRILINSCGYRQSQIFICIRSFKSPNEKFYHSTQFSLLSVAFNMHFSIKVILVLLLPTFIKQCTQTLLEEKVKNRHHTSKLFVFA